MIFFVSFVNISHKMIFLTTPSPSFFKAFLIFGVISFSIKFSFQCSDILSIKTFIAIIWNKLLLTKQKTIIEQLFKG